MASVFMKKGVLFFIILRFLVSGIEEYMILPTAWKYIHFLGESEIYLGIVLAAYGAAVVVFTPLLSKLTDKYRCPKLMLLFCHALRMCGNALYAISLSPFYALIGRILCGISAASDVLLLGELGRTTKAKHRANVFFLLDGIYILGCAMGPTLATIFTFNFSVSGWKVIPENSSGFVLAVIWLVIFMITLVLPRDFSLDEELSDAQLVLTPSGFAESFAEDAQKTAVDRSQILCLLSYIFFIWFFLSVTGFYTPLFASELFNFGQFHINLLFGNGLLLQLVLFLFCYVIKEKIDERFLLLIAMFLQAVPLIIMGTFGLNWSHEYMFLLLVFILVGTPLVSFTVASSLLSKITHPQLTGYYQRLAYTAQHIALFLSRIVAAFFFKRTLLAWLGLQLGFLWLMITVSYTLVFFMKY
ncbi:uncharacterized protein LOC114528667 isoform X2 [Dendronephthya gigantea]|nr:uncharacterized protein LOC114528667 isoform X2 [Dendronephthya gigantea]XP_028406143.1 uncharacterized protein LOC114528667 isoform X2 [Dendronephthya gigantea]